MAEIASAYVSLIPSASKLGKGIESQLGAAGDAGGQSAGKRATSALGKWLKRGALAVGVAVGSILATALVKGWGRLTSIENATAKLTGLGNSASSVKSIMDNALASVKGTAFGLDEAATTAASVVAAGIKPGKDLEGVLKTVADTATIAGKSMADTGAIFGSVAARGKLQGDDLMQLQSAGVPVLAMLAKHYGITAAAASQMVTKGKVDFKNFNAALQENLGGAALKSGETTQGAFKNMGAALSRFGAMLLSSVFPAAKSVFGYINTVIDNLNTKLAPAVDRASKMIAGALEIFIKGDYNPKNWPGFEEDSKVIDFLFRIREAAVATRTVWTNTFGAGSGSIFDTFRSGITMNAADRKEFADSLADDKWMRYGATVRAGLDNAVAAARASVPKVKEAASEFWSALTTGAGGDSFAARIGETLRSAGQNAKAMILPAFSGTIDRLQSIWGKLADTGKRALKPLMEIIGALATAFGDAFQTISGTGLSVWGLLLKAADGLASLLQTYLVPALESLAKWLKENRTIVGAAITALVAYKTASFAIATAQKAWAVATGIVTAAQKLLNGAMKANPIGIVITLIAALAAGFAYLWTHSEGFRNFWIGLWNGIKSAVSGFLNFFTKTVPAAFRSVIDWVKNNWQTIAQILISIFIPGGIIIAAVWRFKDQILSFFKMIWDGIKTGIDAVVGFFTSLPGKILDALKAAGSFLLDVGKQLAQWLLDGIKFIFVDAPKAFYSWVVDNGGLIGIGKKIIGALADAIASGAVAVWDFFKSLPGKILDLLKTAGTWLLDTGKAILKGAWNGIVSAAEAVWTFFKELPGKILSFVVSAATWLYNTGNAIMKGAWNGIVAAAIAVWDFFMGLQNKIVGYLKTAGTWLLDTGKAILKGAWNGIVAGAESVWTWMRELPGKVKSAIGDAGKWLFNIGKDIIQGLINGIKNMASAVWGAVKDAVSGAVNGVKNFLGIGSPSKLFAGFGMNIGEGLANGIKGSAALVSGAADDLSAATVIGGGSTFKAPQLAMRSVIPAHESIAAAQSAAATDMSGTNARLDRLIAEFKAMPGRTQVFARADMR